MDYYQIGQRIRKIRKAHKLSQDELADSVSSTGDELQQLLDGCNSQQAKVILDIAKSAKTALEKYY